MKTSVYSWRLEPAQKAKLEELARKQDRAVADVLHEAVSQWLSQQGANDADEVVEQRLRRAAMAAIGRVSGGDANRASEARARVRETLLSRRRSSR